MYRLSFVDAGGRTASTLDTEFETECGAVFAGVGAVKAGTPHSLYVENAAQQRNRYAHFIPNSKVTKCLELFGGDVRAAANALAVGGSAK